MLLRAGPFDAGKLIDALKFYLPLYGRQEKEECEVPYKDNGKIMLAKFLWMAEQWVYVDVKEK